LLLAVGAPADAAGFLGSYQPADPHITLAQLGQLAQRAQLPNRAIFRPAGSPVPIPSIVHWKVNHFAAITGQTRGGYLVFDPAFGNTATSITAAALEAESSGFFLVPGEQNSSLWRAATVAEASQVISIGQNR
jgi:ABC-type bacteriocin/lantibiotic exporter with double-glycine peptidase domain